MDEIVSFEGRELKLTNLEKVVYDSTGLTKAGVIAYYSTVAPTMLPYVRDRPVTLVRYPHGTKGTHFFEKNCPSHRPDWMPVAEVVHGKGDLTTYCLLNEAAALAWTANLAALELHVTMGLASDLDQPTGIIFDLDPGPPAGLLECAHLALELRDLLGELSLDAVVKFSGSKGLHVGVPLNTGGVHIDETKAFAAAIGEILVERDPEHVLTRMAKAERKGKIFIDWSQNSRHKTTVAAYSMRGTERPQVSAPVTWDEVEAAASKGDATRLIFEQDAVLDRIESIGDPYDAWLSIEQELPAV